MVRGWNRVTRGHRKKGAAGRKVGPDHACNSPMLAQGRRFQALHSAFKDSALSWKRESLLIHRVAELGSLSSGAKMAMKIFVKRVFTIFASNASFLRVIANLQN